MQQTKDYEITVMSGKLSGSVQISGELPRVLSNAQAEVLEEAIHTVRTARLEFKTMVTFVLTQPAEHNW